MDIVTKIKDGLHQDNNIYDQPDFTMRDNLNGIITDVGSGRYKWSSIKGNSLSFTIGSVDRYMAHCKIKDRLFLITLSVDLSTVKFIEITFVGTVGTPTTRHTIANSLLNLSFDNPIRTIWGFYENEDVQRIYWSDYNNNPRCVNVEAFPAISKFIDYFPVIDKVYGRISASSIISGGSVKAGTIFTTWRFYTDDGYFTDWAPLSNPIIVTSSTPGMTYDKYQQYQGIAPDSNTGKKIVIEISDMDSDFDKVQVCAFYSNDLNIALPGEIFYDGILESSTMSFIYTGNANSGTVTIDDITNTSIKIDKFKDSTVAKKQNVISCVEERPEIDVPAYMEVDISIGIKGIPLDVSGYRTALTTSSQSKALVRLSNARTDEINHLLRRGQWYKAITAVSWNNGTGPINVPEGDLFYISVYSSSVTYLSGEFKAIVVKKKYLLASGIEGGDINTDYRYEYEFLEDEYLDWKSQKVCKTYKSYPQGEVVRLGVLFFDKTGRPFYVRHLRNTNVTYGPGDTTIPNRSNVNPMLSLSDSHGSGDTLYYDNACALLQHLVVNDLDISDIKDEIGGFMIVRSPIIHQYLGMGILVPTYLTGNDVHSFPGLYPYASNGDNYFGCYDFYCPEDLFGLKGFVIQDGDELENIVYVSPYVKAESYTIDSGLFQGFGRREVTEEYNFYQKLFIENDGNTSDSNGILGASHKILSVEKYVIGDDDVPINPSDGTKLYKTLCAGYFDGDNNHTGVNGTHSIVILDITDTAGNIKGPNTNSTKANPLALICAVKRPNADPYGGYSDSSISNSLYISVGHFQEVNASVLSDIKVGDTYIFNGIEIFGGDTYVQLFDYKRLYCSYDLAYQKLGHGMIFPVESTINIGMREGDHLAKNRSYDSSYNTGGLVVYTGKTRLEEFNYNDGYSSDNINAFHIPLPYNFRNNNNSPSRIRFTPDKSPGELRDSFRVFQANDYIDLSSNNGAITNIRFRNDKLIYWQPNEVGYIPVGERALTQSSAGNTIQLGVGGIFERYDELKRNIGNSHQFGLIESPIGFHWYDSRRKVYISISDNLQITQDSIVKGLDKFFQTVVIDDMELYDNPFATYGIYGGYDNKSKMIFSTFKMYGGVTKTIGIEVLINKFTGFYDIYPAAYIEQKDRLYHVHSNLLSAYIHGTGTYMNFFGTQYDAIVQIVVKENTNTAKIFDTFEIVSSANFFNKILYENSSQSIEESICSYSGSLLVLNNRDYHYMKRRWFGNFPKVSRERLNDGYLLITFKLEDPVLVELFEMTSTVRKNY